jgi:hypothetical protein
MNAARTTGIGLVVAAIAVTGCAENREDFGQNVSIK